ncbi:MULTISPECIES: hypothetical protein, partial [unclassified Microcoleus]|uniref:hypothetical protein n=1 Tax=unclassified Microcoleus TaxID=2642155 RepID=UPI001E149C87
MFEQLGDRDLRAGFKKPGFSVYALSPNSISRRNRVSGPGCKVRDRYASNRQLIGQTWTQHTKENLGTSKVVILFG